MVSEWVSARVRMEATAESGSSVLHFQRPGKAEIQKDQWGERRDMCGLVSSVDALEARW